MRPILDYTPPLSSLLFGLQLLQLEMVPALAVSFVKESISFARVPQFAQLHEQVPPLFDHEHP